MGASAQTTGGGGATAGASGAAAGASSSAAAGTARSGGVTPSAPTTGTANGTSVNDTAGTLTRQQQLQRAQQLQRQQELQQQQTLPPGLQNRQLPPGLNRQGQLPPGLNNRFLVPGTGVITNSSTRGIALGGTTNFTGVGPTNQFVSSSNSATGLSNQVSGITSNIDNTGLLTSGGVGAVPGTTSNGLIPSPNQTNQFTTGAGGISNVASGSMRSQLPRGDRAFTVADQALLNRIRRDMTPIMAGSTAGLPPVNLVLRNGVVTLTGSLPTLEMRQRILGIVQSTPGVLQVVDNTSISPNGAGTALGGSTGSGENVITGSGNSQGLNRGALPPGLQNREQLPPGLQNRQTLPRGLSQQTNTPSTTR